ncbi:MAG: 2-oxoacid:acceptor oxidoreductase family protein [Saprospiraceae bacterium]|nr:2-oxoacid:acceptor oxidoreductase family protein [Saprospiraceae bacterium]
MRNGAERCKIMIAGVGGQGIVYLSNLIVEAAVASGISASVSEIHGLSQRSGIVTSGIGLGEHCTGFLARASVDLLFGLEALETQRCLPWLHRNSSVVFCNHRLLPHAVNARTAEYPDPGQLARYLQNHCREVVCIDTRQLLIDTIRLNLFCLGVATRLAQFPLETVAIEQALARTSTERNLEKSLEVFRQGMECERNPTCL